MASYLQVIFMLYATQINTLLVSMGTDLGLGIHESYRVWQPGSFGRWNWWLCWIHKWFLPFLTHNWKNLNTASCVDDWFFTWPLPSLKRGVSVAQPCITGRGNMNTQQPQWKRHVWRCNHDVTSFAQQKYRGSHQRRIFLANKVDWFRQLLRPHADMSDSCGNLEGWLRKKSQTLQNGLRWHFTRDMDRVWSQSWTWAPWDIDLYNVFRTPTKHMESTFPVNHVIFRLSGSARLPDWCPICWYLVYVVSCGPAHTCTQVVKPGNPQVTVYQVVHVIRLYTIFPVFY